MCNRINGTYVGDSEEYLTDILRKEWGFDGYVMSDWGAVNNRVQALKAGLDLEMPSSNGINDAQIVKAVQEGTLDETVVNQEMMAAMMEEMTIRQLLSFVPGIQVEMLEQLLAALNA